MNRILTFSDNDDVKVVGQLGSMLVKTKRAGIAIADGFIVPLGVSVGVPESAEILAKFDQLKTDTVILRSSPITYGYRPLITKPVRRAELIGAIKRMQLKARQDWAPSAIIVQVFLEGELNGTIHTRNPYTGARDEMIIEADLWTESKIQSDEDITQMIMLNRRDGTIAFESNDEIPYLELRQIQNLYHTARRLEDALDAPVSMDWGFVNGVSYILNTKPLKNSETL